MINGEDVDVEKWLEAGRLKSSRRRYRCILIMFIIFILGCVGLLVGASFAYAYLENIDPEAWYLDPCRGVYVVSWMVLVVFGMVGGISLGPGGQEFTDKFFD